MLLNVTLQLGVINDGSFRPFYHGKRRISTFEPSIQMTYLLSDTPKTPRTSAKACPSKTPVYNFISKTENTEENEILYQNGFSKTLVEPRNLIETQKNAER